MSPQKPGFRFLAIRHYHIVEQRDWQPALNMYETEQAIVIVAELAGIDRKDLIIDVEPNVVRIQGIRQPVTFDDMRRIHRMEIAAGPFQIEAMLPNLIDPELARSQYDHGLLKIVLPLAQRPSRRLVIGESDDTSQAEESEGAAR